MRTAHVLLLGLLSIAQCLAGAVGIDSDAAASAKVDALFVAMTRGVQPGAGVLVVEHGRIVHKATYGYADLERHIPLSVDATFRLDSVSKQFTSMAIMQLKEDGTPGSTTIPSVATCPSCRFIPA